MNSFQLNNMQNMPMGGMAGMGVIPGMVGMPNMPNLAAMGGMPGLPMGGLGNMQMQGQQRAPPVGGVVGQPNSTLYVGNIDSDLDEQRLYEYFSQYGPVSNVRIMRDLYSGESRGFAFVNYAQAADAKRAKLVLNHTTIQDNQIRVCFKRNPSEIDQKANLFVSNLDPKVTSRELEELCQDHGAVVSCFVREDASTSQSLGYGYVQFENEKAATSCIQALNGTKLYEKEIAVQVFVPRNKRATANQRNNLYLKGFPTSYSEQNARDFINEKFSVFGTIESVGINLDSNIKRVYAFVSFKSGEDARKAVQELNGLEIDSDNKLFVDFAQQKSQRRQMLKQKHLKYKNETNLYVRSIKPGTTEAQFRAAFEKYGTINSVCIKKHEFPSKAGIPEQPQAESKELLFGFINFPKSEEAKNAFTEGKKDPDVLALIDPTHNEKTEFIYYAQPAPMRKQYLRMIKKNFKATQLMQVNLAMMNQNFYKMMKQNNGGGRTNNFNRQQGGANNGGQRPPKFNNSNNKRGTRDNNPMTGNFMQPMLPMMGMNPQQMMMMQQGMMGGMNPMFMQQQQMMNMAGLQGGIIPQPNIVSNPVMQQPSPLAPQPPQAGVKTLQWIEANLYEFENLPKAEQKVTLGTLMYNKINGKANENLVPKITGMLIDLEVLELKEVIEILKDDEMLQERINEAINIIEEDHDGN